MSDCAAKVASGSDKVEMLIASMRDLASNPPLMQPGHTVTPEEDSDAEYRLSLRVMELLELPDTVRGLVGDHAFMHAARAAMVEAPALQLEVQGLLEHVQEPSTAAQPGFDLGHLVKQQNAAYTNLPRQVAAGALDAFGSPTLTPVGAAEAFVANLLLDENSSHGPLLCRFIERRSELLRDILEGQAASFGGADTEGAASRLIAAAMAFEGTIVLASALCSSGAAGAPPPLLASAIKALLADSGHDKDSALLKQKVDTVTAALAQRTVGAGSLAGELARLGAQFLKAWAPEEGTESGGRTLAARFGCLVASSASRNCAQLGKLQQSFSERLTSYRRSLAEGAGLGAADWAGVWSGACGLFCPGRGAPRDALTLLSSSIEAACAELVRERVNELKLVLVADDSEDAEQSTGAAARADEECDDSKRSEDIAELRRRSQARVGQFDDQLGEILEDAAHVSSSGEIPGAVTAALLEALEGRLKGACEALNLETVQPLWPSRADYRKPSWSQQRDAARAALALDALLSAADSSTAEATAKLGGALKTAASSGSKTLAGKAEAILSSLKTRSEEVFCTWARLAVLSNKNPSTLSAFWSLANDEVGPTCGWGSAKFAGKTEQDSKSVPVPVQASPFVFERLVSAAQRGLELAGNGAGPGALSGAAALKAALGESLMAAYEADQPADLARLKRSGMAHLLQWLFDLNFLRITLSAGAGQGSPAYEALRELLSKAESVAFSDPVDRLLYQEVLKSSVNSHVQGTKILLAPFFLHNPLYGFLSQGQAPAGAAGAANKDAFQIEAQFAPPLRPVLPRFPLLPIAMNAGSGNSTSELDRLRLDPAERARAASAKASGPGQAGAAVSSLMQQAGGFVGSGLGSLGIGGIGSGLWGGSNKAAGSGYPGKAPEAV
eukprot:TRINITY_DN43208_c0_g1_i1.p1 TRINITY_DN43208_c0_g1~~TRINITY_DN43208_c0_g1_i1.p1  ORF type:complete len:985 (+),score=220.34 TRINITY_DN43208_c0_g1_i1:256-2955(+)